jgi:hypothetical protein
MVLALVRRSALFHGRLFILNSLAPNQRAKSRLPPNENANDQVTTALLRWARSRQQQQRRSPWSQMGGAIVIPRLERDGKGRKKFFYTRLGFEIE